MKKKAVEKNIEKIKIIANKEADAKELSYLENIAIVCGLENVFINNSGERRSMGADLPPTLWILIEIVAGCFTAGFFGAIGVDLWKKIKSFIIKTFNYYESKYPGEHTYNPNIHLEIKTKNQSIIQINFPKNNNKELEKSLEKLDKILKKNKINKFSALYFLGGRYFPKRKWRVLKEKCKIDEEYK